MKAKRKVQIAADLAMTAMLPLLMAYNMIGDAAHEWIGIAMFAMFILHHVLNFRFAASFAKGKYTPSRVLLTVIDLLLFADMLALMISAVMLSRHVFGFLDIDGGFSVARTMHLLASYWGLVLMSVHIGFHFQGSISKIQKTIPNGQRNAFKIIFRVLCVGISAYGLYAFLSRKLIDYMLLKTQFVFFDYSEPVLRFMLDYVTIIVLFGTVGYYVAKLFRIFGNKHRNAGKTL